jgi:hypothetical protein
MKREVIYNVLNKMMIHYFKIKRTCGRRKLFDCVNYLHTGPNLSFKNPIFVRNISEVEIDPNLMKKDVNPNQVFSLRFLENYSFEELLRCNVKNISV